MNPQPTIMPRFDLAQLLLLYDLAEAVSRADDPNEIYRAAVDGLAGAIADRASVRRWMDTAQTETPVLPASLLPPEHLSRFPRTIDAGSPTR